MLEGLFGKTVTLQNGETMTVDEAYVRESILKPAAKITAGFQPIMPTFQGLVTEEQLLAADRIREITEGTAAGANSLTWPPCFSHPGTI